MKNKWLSAGAFFAGLSVILGAFAAHGLQKYLEAGSMDEKMLHNFETGARYQMYHAFALLFTGLLVLLKGPSKMLNAAGTLFSIGIVLFSGSLYLLSTRNVIGLSSWEWLGPVTPFGGMCFITAWMILLVYFFRHKSPQTT